VLKGWKDARKARLRTDRQANHLTDGLLAGWMEGRRREHGTALAGMASWIVPY